MFTDMLQNEQQVFCIRHKNRVRNRSQKLATDQTMKGNMKKS